MADYIKLQPLDPDDTCRCGHPVRQHDAGHCWVDKDGNADPDTYPPACPCSWLEVQS